MGLGSLDSCHFPQGKCPFSRIILKLFVVFLSVDLLTVFVPRESSESQKLSVRFLCFKSKNYYFKMHSL